MTIAVAATLFPPSSAAPQTPTPAVTPEQALRYWEELSSEQRHVAMASFLAYRKLVGNDAPELVAFRHGLYGDRPIHDDAVGGTWLTREQAARWAHEIWADLLIG